MHYKTCKQACIFHVFWLLGILSNLILSVKSRGWRWGRLLNGQNLLSMMEVTKIVTERKGKSFMQKKQNLVSLGYFITQYW